MNDLGEAESEYKKENMRTPKIFYKYYKQNFKNVHNNRPAN